MERGIEIRRSFVVNLPAGETFAFWRRPSNFPRFMRHVESVEELDSRRSRWTVAGPAGREAAWDAEIVDEEPGRALSWRTVGDAEIRHGGRVEFHEATAGRGTVVSVRIRYESPAGAIRPALAKVFADDPETQIQADLRRFQQLAETGEIAPARAAS